MTIVIKSYILYGFCAFLAAAFPANLTNDDGAVVTSSIGDYSKPNGAPNISHLGCSIQPTDIYLHNKIVKILKVEKLALIEYQLSFVNYSDAFDPFYSTTSVAYRLNKWSRVTTSHGQTLLSLAFNYGVLSVKTLTIGTTSMDVQLYDRPHYCFLAQSDDDKIILIRDLVMKDMNPDGQISFVNEERACHEIIVDEGGIADFKDRCYTLDPNTKQVVIDDGQYNFWLTLLNYLLFIIKILLFLFAPSLFSSLVLSLSSERIPYVVEMKQSLTKTLHFCVDRNYPAQKLPYIHFTGSRNYRKLAESMKKMIKDKQLSETLKNRSFKVQFKRYDIEVDYRRMLTENVVPVGLLETLFETIFRCRIQKSGPFVECCYGNTLTFCVSDETVSYSWLRFVKTLALAGVVVLLPLPYYVRLVVFYLCEYEEISYRKQVTADRGLQEQGASNLIQYYLPTSALFICMYIGYFAAAIFFALIGRTKYMIKMKEIIFESFRDLERQDWVDTLSVFTSNILWPLKRYGFFGFLVGLVYWPLMLPVTAVACCVYCLPTIYIIYRMAVRAKTAIFVRFRISRKKKYQVSLGKDLNIEKVVADDIFEKNCDCARTQVVVDADEVDPDLAMSDKNFETSSIQSDIRYYDSFQWKRFFFFFLVTLLCVLILLTVVIIFAEVCGSLVELVVFTIMGVIVNASALLKYVALILMVFGYCCDCFNNMGKKYLKLNKAIFAEVKGRIKDLMDVTSLPSSLQENRGFKAQELSEQGKHESPDDFSPSRTNHWIINDLVLFVDSQDMPRIPRKLFDDVCQIRVAGVPGPVYRGHLEALQQFLKIVVFIGFVFVIIQTFAGVYQVSSTNQVLATMLGGLLPLILKTFLAPPAPDIEIGSVSFKSKMDEIIKNFKQQWPIYDLSFDPADESAAESKDGKKDNDAKDNNNAGGKVIKESKDSQIATSGQPPFKAVGSEKTFSDSDAEAGRRRELKTTGIIPAGFNFIDAEEAMPATAEMENFDLADSLLDGNDDRKDPVKLAPEALTAEIKIFLPDSFFREESSSPEPLRKTSNESYSLSLSTFKT